MFDIEAFSLKNANLKCIDKQLHNALNDKGRFGIIYRGVNILYLLNMKVLKIYPELNTKSVLNHLPPKYYS